MSVSTLGTCCRFYYIKLKITSKEIQLNHCAIQTKPKLADSRCEYVAELPFHSQCLQRHFSFTISSHGIWGWTEPGTAAQAADNAPCAPHGWGETPFCCFSWQAGETQDPSFPSGFTEALNSTLRLFYCSVPVHLHYCTHLLHCTGFPVTQAQTTGTKHNHQRRTATGESMKCPKFTECNLSAHRAMKC